jgi:MFS family permease
MVLGLGSAWILDGLQITISSSVTGVLTKPQTLHMTSTEIGLIASIYLVGEVFGALVFGKLSDRLGRKRLLIVTLLSSFHSHGRLDFLWFHSRGRLAATKSDHPQFDATIYTLDRLIPTEVLTFGLRDAFTPSGAAQWWAFAYALLGWVLIIAVVAGVTAAVRRE